MIRYVLLITALTFAGSIFISCDFDSSPTGSLNSHGGGGGGATPGGAQDFDFIRGVIERGGIPKPGNFVVEGIYSEYDLPIYGEPSEDPLVIRTAHGYAPDQGITGGGLYAQVGLSSNVDMENFRRNALNLSVVVDVSGSMSRDRKMPSVRAAVISLIDNLNADDLLSVVLFSDSVDILISPTPVSDRDSLQKMVDGVRTLSGTNIDIGLRQGYSFVREHLNQGDRASRVLLFTDALPNIGNTSPDNFKELISGGAEELIGFTGYGVGSGFNQNLMDYIATVRNANYYYISGEEEVGGIFNDNFDFMFHPLAFDLTFSVTPSQWFTCTGAYGFPGDDLSSPELEVSTVFLSRNRGALMLKFAPDDTENYPIILKDEHVADVRLTYVGTDGSEIENSLEIKYSGDNVVSAEDSYFEQQGVRKATALTREVLGLIEACTEYLEGRHDSALNILDNLSNYLTNENEELGEDFLRKEIDMVKKLRSNISSEEGQ